MAAISKQTVKDRNDRHRQTDIQNTCKQNTKHVNCHRWKTDRKVESKKSSAPL